MNELCLPPELSGEIAAIYQSMASAYDQTAEKISLSCTGCSDNCCDSYFLHHTYSEWAYLWEGLKDLPKEQLDRVIQRAQDYISQSRLVLARGERPQLMCPLNKGGLCSLYSHRLMICRTHGVPATLTSPDGRHHRFPGCFRCQEIVNKTYARPTDAPAMERTALFQRLVRLEMRLLGELQARVPRVRLTIAEMIVNGPPRVTINQD